MQPFPSLWRWKMNWSPEHVFLVSWTLFYLIATVFQKRRSGTTLSSIPGRDQGGRRLEKDVVQ